MTDIRARTLSDFEGRWRLEREIVHDDGMQAQFSGTAVWQPEGGFLRCIEEGTMRIGESAPMVGQRVYLWDAALQVFFEDGRLFHQVPPEGGDTGHWCDPDQYDGRYDFAAWPAFVVTWSVRGPRKAYRMVSRYSPL
ncbi:DUF6314 family protein [Pseudosulfitobacter koreensis]|uniref:DUF6314 family protein n=1 Tax=Pseudosulfitobacter koreensis TaxID=2968472 RepID=A0ABT1YXT0_9RHOB|nr:DUF6314 family protein [Pseudosulfitobacter koreense]MCR8825694.1 DUF6314 family protein [Pseudosulfitobacter koreense]